jgi:glycerate kinase
MRILIAPDKFRGSLEAAQVCLAVQEGILLAFPDADCISIPLADGGEGTMEILTKSSGGYFVTMQVQDPLGRPVNASYGLSGDGCTAYIEMASASGLHLLSVNERNPLLTSTYGTGQLIIDALDRGVSKIILGIGGSATTDGGIGMASALGYRFFNASSTILPVSGQSLNDIRRIDIQQVDPRLKSVAITVACDVTNPLYGKNGAAYVYGPQKGADPEMVRELDLGLKNLTHVALQTFGTDVSSQAGSGAAGGLGAGCLWFLNAKLMEGVGIVMEHSQVEDQIRKADLIITGEGKVDEQTLSGKVVKGLAAMSQKYNVPLAVVCGTLAITPQQTRDAGITCAVSVLNRPMNLAMAQTDSYQLVRDATFNLVRLFFNNR